MKGSRKTAKVLVVFGILTVFACVTINIYFPEKEVESVAGEIVSDIRGKNTEEKEQSPKKDQESLLQYELFHLTALEAWAGEVTTVSNPTIRALKKEMKARYSLMKPYYQNGNLKEGQDGYVSVAHTKGLGLKEKRDLQTLVDAENRDRKRLYAEVAKALKIDPSQTNKVAKIFAKEWQKNLP
ncbi:MAG: DUF1318 domain-containing protein [Deltaproteobacteria bacterium]|nr:DUF1318 domain-containing protein [Deltaproteobacteria bacterium]